MKIDKYYHLYGRKDDIVFEEIPKPERKIGKWLKNCDTPFFWKCSECGSYIFWRKKEYLLRNEDEPNYCPNYGADMRGEKE